MINLLSLSPLLQATPAVSTGSSAPVEPDFSALLTELVGPVKELAALPNFPAGTPVMSQQLLPHSASSLNFTLQPEAVKPAEADNATNSPNPGEEASRFVATGAIPRLLLDLLKKSGIVLQPEAAKAAEAVVPTNIPNPNEELPYTVVMDTTPGSLTEALKNAGITIQPETAKPAEGEDTSPLQSAKPGIDTSVALQTLLDGATYSSNSGAELAQSLADLSSHSILDDVKTFEITIQREGVKPEVQLPQLPNQAVITTDPIASVLQTELPPRVNPIQRVSIEAKPSGRKNETTIPQSIDSRTTVPAPQSADAGRTVDTIEQPRAAQQMEFPDVPKLQVVRTVSMEIGEAESQVIIHLEDRGGGMSLHLGAASDTMQRTLKSSVDSLVRALKQEKIELSNIEVSRKAPVDKVRRMKEAH